MGRFVQPEVFALAPPGSTNNFANVRISFHTLPADAYFPISRTSGFSMKYFSLASVGVIGLFVASVSAGTCTCTSAQAKSSCCTTEKDPSYKSVGPFSCDVGDNPEPYVRCCESRAGALAECGSIPSPVSPCPGLDAFVGLIIHTRNA